MQYILYKTGVKREHFQSVFKWRKNKNESKKLIEKVDFVLVPLLRPVPSIIALIGFFSRRLHFPKYEDTFSRDVPRQHSIIIRVNSPGEDEAISTSDNQYSLAILNH